MMTLLEYAEDVNRNVLDIIEKCQELGIDASSEDSILEEEDIIMLDNNLRRRRNRSSMRPSRPAPCGTHRSCVRIFPEGGRCTVPGRAGNRGLPPAYPGRTHRCRPAESDAPASDSGAAGSARCHCRK